MTVEGDIYFAAVYLDDGDGVFVPEADLPMYDASGAALLQPFMIELPQVQ